MCRLFIYTPYFYIAMDIVNNKKMFRFEALQPDGEYVFLEYRWLKGSMVLMHTFVPPSARGSGKGEEIVQFVLDHAKNNNLKVIAYCPFAVKYIKDHNINLD